jgi:hypothetical protein
MAATDSSRAMHEQPPLVRLFRTASPFCTRWMKRAPSMSHPHKLTNSYQIVVKYLPEVGSS